MNCSKSKIYFLLTIILMVFGPLAFAQELNMDQIIPLEGTRPGSFDDYLVQLAWQNLPKTKILDRNVEIAKLNVKGEKMEWLKAFNANVGFNSLKDTVQVLGALYLAPGYNYGLSVSLGQLLTTGPRVQIAKEKQKVEELERDQNKLILRKEVLHRYKEYLLSIEIFKTRQLAEEDASATFQLVSALFKKNRADFDEKNKASITYYEAMEKRLAAQTEVAKSKLSLEEILGVKWEQVERVKTRYGQ